MNWKRSFLSLLAYVTQVVASKLAAELLRRVLHDKAGRDY